MSTTERDLEAPATPEERDAEAMFERIWRPPRGLARLSAVNQTILGRRYMVTGIVFFLIGGALALMMRLQLAVPGNTFLTDDQYNQLFTLHGTTMMFLFAVPVVEGIAVYLIPLMIGARDLVFPRLSSFGYWCYLLGGILLYSSVLFAFVPDAGWFAYTPLSGPRYSPGPSMDFWLLGVTFAEISAVAAAIELAVTILKARAPGMSINRMPLFAWYMLVVALMILFGFPSLILGSILLEIERAFGWPFFTPGLGGDPLLWQHYFWIFGHPEVYVIFLPAAGMVSMIVPTFARRPLAGHTWVILAVVGTGFVSMGLWVHHMFTTGMPLLAMGFFSSASMTVSVLTGIQVFAWLATLWLGKPVLRTPLLFVAGFIFIFVIGGLTGVMLAVVPFNWQVHDTYFVVAHFHYVLIGGLVFPLLAAAYYWLPNMTGRMMSERLGRWIFWVMFGGFNLAFLPMHVSGFLGMPRRVYTYQEGLGWEPWNLASSIGAFIFAGGVLLFVFDVIRSLWWGARAPHNPWNAGTLEWATDSPAPPYNFRSIPTIESAYPLWDQQNLFRDIKQGRFALGDPSSGLRLTAGSTPTHGELDQVIVLPKPTYIPLVAALATALFFVGFLSKQYQLAVAALVALLGVFLYWGWQEPIAEQKAPVPEAQHPNVTLGAEGPKATGWWGVVLTIIVDALLYIALAFGFVLLWSRNVEWPPGNFAAPPWALVGAACWALVIGLVGPLIAKLGLRRKRPGLYHMGLLVGIGSGIVHLWLLERVRQTMSFAPTDHSFAAMFYALLGYSALHVGIGILLLGFALARAAAPDTSRRPFLTLKVVSLFWYYVVALGLVTAALIYALPDWVG